MHWRKGDSSTPGHHDNTLRRLTEALHAHLSPGSCDPQSLPRQRCSGSISHLNQKERILHQGQGSPEKQNQQDVDVRKDAFQGTGSHDYGGCRSEVSREGHQAGDPGKRQHCSSSQRLSAGRIPSSRTSVFVLLRPLTDGIRPTAIMEGNCFTPGLLIEMLISSKNTDISSQNYLERCLTQYRGTVAQ